MKRHFSMYLPMLIGGMLSIGHATAANYQYNQNEYPDYYMNPNNRETPYEYNYYERNYRSDENSEAYPSSTYHYVQPRVYTQFEDQRYAPSQASQNFRSDNEGNVYRNNMLNESSSNYRPRILTEDELLSQINNESRSIYFKMNIDGRVLARQLAAQSNYVDKNQAVRDAFQQASKNQNVQPATKQTGNNSRNNNGWMRSSSSYKSSNQ